MYNLPSPGEHGFGNVYFGPSRKGCGNVYSAVPHEKHGSGNVYFDPPGK